MRPGRVCSQPVPYAAHQVWQAPLTPAISPHGQRPGDRAALLRPSGGENSHRDPYQRHAPQRRLFLVAVHGHPMTLGITGILVLNHAHIVCRGMPKTAHDACSAQATSTNRCSLIAVGPQANLL